MTPYTLHHGDCLEVLRTLSDASVDAVVTDPPYGLSFMGKRWDYDVPSVDVWTECLRVLKPGGHLLAFAGTRTQHRMAVRIEDAGFDIRDLIAWVYGSGFSKSFNMHRVDACECEGNAIPSAHGKTESEHDMRRLRNTHLSQAIDAQQEREQGLFASVQQQPARTCSTLHAGGDSQAGGEDARREQPSVERGQVHRTGQGLCHGEDGIAPEGEGQRLRSGAHSGSGEDVGKAASRRGGGTPQEPQQGGQQAGESGGVREPQGPLDAGALRVRGACPRCGKLRKEFAGFGTGLKPALEPITVARKPLDGTVAENVLEHGTGALNVDGCRVGTEQTVTQMHANASDAFDVGRSRPKCGTKANLPGRWPANLIHDGSEEVVGLFPETGPSRASEAPRGTRPGGFGDVGHASGSGVPNGQQHNDSGGSAARFFYCAKASKADRDAGCDGLEAKQGCADYRPNDDGTHGLQSRLHGASTKGGNHHPTVKPTDLMRYLCRLVTPPGGVILDPFTGSGSTGRGAILEGFRFVGIEREADYITIARARIEDAVAVRATEAAQLTML